MTDQSVLYTTRWTNLTRRPMAGHDWVSVDEARRLYESETSLVVVDAEVRDEAGVPVPRWVIGLGTSGRIRVQFFDASTTIWHLVDYDRIEGRLWRWITNDYFYEDTSATRSMGESTRTVKASVEVDGTGYVTVVDKAGRGPGQRQTTDFVGRASEAYWLDWPAFGDWSSLTDPGQSAHEVAGIDLPVTN